MWMQAHIYSVKAKSQVGNIWVKDIMATKKRPKPQDTQIGILKIYSFCQKIQQKASGPRERCWVYVSVYEKTLEKLPQLYLMVQGRS